MGLSPLVFTGVSNFSNDFQTILNRAVAIARLPITALQNRQSDILQEKQLTVNLSSVVSDLAASVTNLGTVAANQGITGSSSDTTKVIVNSTAATAPVSYAITDISSLAQAASETTLSGYADGTTAPVASSGSVQLMVGGQAVGDPITMDAPHNNLTALRDAINAIPNSGVTAAILTTGTGATPDYLSISAVATGQNEIQLMDGAVNLMTNTNPGANADFYINGAHVVSPTNKIQAVIPGMSFTLVGETANNQTVTISASSNSSPLASALQDFADKYNAVVAQLDAQIGPAAGMLSGNHLIYAIQNALHGLVNYTGTGAGAVTSLAALGISLDSTGKMTFNQTSTDPQVPAFNDLSSSQIAAAFSFLNSGQNNFASLAATLTAFSDPITGAIKAQQNQYDATDSSLTDQINTLIAHANQMQTTLQAKLQAADTQLASLQSQQQTLTSMVQSLNFTSYGYQNTNTSLFNPGSSSGG
ncbi:MAG TPA: flagellar filament capping protein FliD [Bryobacteraceae bacterium]|nr:flagellar filament capping protein FliD [Bryobacteraceae bacterium]